MNIIAEPTNLDKNYPSWYSRIALFTHKLIAGDFGYFSTTRSTHSFAREAYKHHKNTSLKNRNRVGIMSAGKLRKFVTRVVVARLSASRGIDWFTVPVVWNEISHISMTEWKEVPTFLKFAWYISAHMKEHGKRYCAFTLDIGKDLLVQEDWSNKKPKEIKDLKNRMRERLKTAIPEQYGRMFTIELDNAGRPHIHGIVFGCTYQQLEKHREAIKKAGGKWSGNNSKYQLVIKGRQNFDDALGWMSYSTKANDAYVYVPETIRDQGKAHYLATKQKIEAIQDSNRIADKQLAIDTDNRQKTKVLEKINPMQSNPENIRHSNLKSAPEPTESPDSKESPEYGIWS